MKRRSRPRKNLKRNLKRKRIRLLSDVAKDEPNYKPEAEEEKRPQVRSVTHGTHMVKGEMDHGMEDYIVAETRHVDGHELGLYAVFDGHSGRAVADYLQDHLFDNILNQPDFWRNTLKAVKRAYKKTDDEILSEVVGSRGGSTAVTAILIDKKRLVVANVGDSRAVVCKEGVAKQVTVDHEPLKEKDMVESRGGRVIRRPGNIPRVDGTLAMTRAFGDGSVKDHITSEPDITVQKIDEKVEFIILASDGVWKVMSNQEVADCIKDSKNAQEAAETVIEEAIVRKSHDDISCIVVCID